MNDLLMGRKFLFCRFFLNGEKVGNRDDKFCDYNCEISDKENHSYPCFFFEEFYFYVLLN